VSSWEDLPPMFFKPPTPRRVALVVRVKPSLPWLRDDLAATFDALAAVDPAVAEAVAARSSDQDGAVLNLTGMDEACAVRHAAWRLAADPSADRRVRVQAIEVERALDAATDGAAAGCLVRTVAALQRAGGFGPPTSLRLIQRGARRPVRFIGSSGELAGLEAAIALIPSVFASERQRVWDSMTPLPDGFDDRCGEVCEESFTDEECPHFVRHVKSFCEGMHAVQELLEHAGAEAWVLEDYSNYPDSPCVVWFRRPGDRCLFWEVTKFRSDPEVMAWPMEAVDEEEFYKVIDYGYVGNPRRHGGSR